MKNGEKTLVSSKKYYIITAVVIFCGILAALLYPMLTQAHAEVVYLRTSFPAQIQTEVVEYDPVYPEHDEADLDPEQRLVSMLQKDDLQVIYEKMEDTEKWHVVRMKVTGYCSCRKCCGKFSDGKTANQHRIRKGDVFVAADKRYSFGTEMIIPGYNQTQPVQVLDRGRLIKGNRLDVYFDTHRQAQKWGVKNIDVLVKTND